MTCHNAICLCSQSDGMHLSQKQHTFINFASIDLVGIRVQNLLGHSVPLFDLASSLNIVVFLRQAKALHLSTFSGQGM